MLSFRDRLAVTLVALFVAAAGSFASASTHIPAAALASAAAAQGAEDQDGQTIEKSEESGKNNDWGFFKQIETSVAGEMDSPEAASGGDQHGSKKEEERHKILVHELEMAGESEPADSKQEEQSLAQPSGSIEVEMAASGEKSESEPADAKQEEQSEVEIAASGEKSESEPADAEPADAEPADAEPADAKQKEQSLALDDVMPAPEGKTKITIQIDYDRYPGDTTWNLHSESGNLVASGPDATPDPYSQEAAHIDVVPGTYILTIADSYGDGSCCYAGDGSYSCCNEGDGSYAVYAHPLTGPVVLAQGTGDYGSGTAVEIAVPADNAGGCVDGTENFLVDDDHVESCAWLAENFHGYGYLCHFLDVSTACPSTCDKCDAIRATKQNGCEMDMAGEIHIDDAVGAQTCDWLADHLDRFEGSCIDAGPALHCPATCQLSCDSLPTVWAEN